MIRKLRVSHKIALIPFLVAFAFVVIVAITQIWSGIHNLFSARHLPHDLGRT